MILGSHALALHADTAEWATASAWTPFHLTIAHKSSFLNKKEIRL